MSNARGNEFTFAIKEHLGVIKEYSNGWTKELNLVEWNGNEAKIDLREWNPDHDRMSRGITLLPEEMKTIVEIMGDRL